MKKDVITLRVNPVSKSDSIKVDYEEMNILCPADTNRLIAACEGSVWEIPILLSLYTGMSQGECLGLHWSEVDFDNSTISVKYTLEYIKGSYTLGEPKNKYRRRVFEVTAEVIELLKKHKEVQKLRKLSLGALYNDQAIVCAMENGSYMRGPTLTEGLQEILNSAEIKRIRFHDLRHTHISISLASGESVVRVSRRVGHANPSITLKRYSHCIPGDLGAPVQFSEALKQAKKQPEK